MSVSDDAMTLYEGVVTDPGSWTEQAFVDWGDAAAGAEGIDRVAAKYLRRVMATAVKLQSFWQQDRRRDDQSIEWRSRVDLALGPKAWRPVLDLAAHELEHSPNRRTYDTVAELFRVVNNRPFMDGLTFDEWLEETHRR